MINNLAVVWLLDIGFTAAQNVVQSKLNSRPYVLDNVFSDNI